MATDIATCKQCLHKTADHYCANPRTLDTNGKPCLARHVWYVSYNNRGDYCAGKFFEPLLPSNAERSALGDLLCDAPPKTKYEPTPNQPTEQRKPTHKGA